MPYLNARISGSEIAALSEQVAARLVSLTTEILHKNPELTSIAVESVDERQWFVAGVPISSQDVKTFFLEAHITGGTNTKDEKAAYVEATFAAMQSLLGPLHPASYVVITEVPGDSWGYAGATQEFRYIKGKC